ncbi:nucleotidyltransferase domain-containing protein [Microbacterium allomyrinae]|uniref:Amino acid transporter n=1 Tax=Microbacterium allomyrinae TaxID=2830666 RepID=A0A9X1LSN5_9MICO|nr:hypothetical protein [Microbacterium allomyrinae]MCC2031254.1 hypothetical protein [Microbacterium allomyrinae]
MTSQVPAPAPRWVTPTPEAVAEVLEQTTARWWLSGGVALDRWLGRSIRDRPHTDVSTTSRDVAQLVRSLPASLSAWASGGEGVLVPWAELPADADLQPVRIHDDDTDTWVLRLNVEDGSDQAWVYRRDPRLQLPWDAAVLDIDGIPTGAPEVQLVWKALRPRPQDDIDKDAVLPQLSEEARAWWERAVLSIHPHSTWSIHVRSPLFPAKASWNRTRR